MKPAHTFFIAMGAAVLSSFLGTGASGAESPQRLHLSVLHQLGMDDKSFGTSTGTLEGLNFA